MATPELKQFGELEAEDFERYPVWVGCHTADFGEPWYEDTDEETFRPHTGELPVDPAKGMFLVRTEMELHDGSRHPGFATPAAVEWDQRPNGAPVFKHNHILGTQQPQIFAEDRSFSFWGGRAEIPERAQQEFYGALGKTPDAIFPLRFNADPGLAVGTTGGQIDGFYRQDSDGIHVGFSAVGDQRAGRDSAGPTWFQLSGRGGSGYPQPEKNFEYLRIGYAGTCLRCGMADHAFSALRKPGARYPRGLRNLAGFMTPSLRLPQSLTKLSRLASRGFRAVQPLPSHGDGARRRSAASDSHSGYLC